ncbi:MAG: HAMP domain-containing sensor histidine kinase [Hyphomicrobiaceae bacterium]|jgi:two-component system cell cycle sensor histidine kinase PleC
MFSGAISAGKPNTLMGEYALRLGEAVLRNRTREAEQLASIEVQLANKVKSEFIANMSHELRTPLNTIMGFSKLLGEHGRRQLTDQDIMDYARLIHDAAAHLLSVINDILDISKIQSGKYALDAREVSLDEVLKACVASYRAVAETAGLNLEYRQEDGLPAVRGDAQRLKQAFNNLIGNAVRFTRPGGAIVVQARPLADGGAEVRVRDTGVGMDEEEIRVALTPFGQVDGSRSRWREGAGLGLPIANALIELHAGELGIESRKLQGTEVVVTLPPPQVLSFIQDRNPTRGRPAASQG